MANDVRTMIAAEVRAELARQRKTQRQVAGLLGISQPAVQLRLAGRRAFRAEEIAQLADWLGVPAARFLEAPGPAGPTPTGPANPRPTAPPRPRVA